MNEEWRDILGYEGLYKVSNLGMVYSMKRKKIMKLSKTEKGYYKVYLMKDGTGKHKKVHRLVAEAFIPNPNNLPQVNHKDEDKTNNIVTNLEWCTAEYNSNYGTHKEKLRIASTGRILPKDAVVSEIASIL